MIFAHDTVMTFVASTDAFLALATAITDDRWRGIPAGEEWSAAHTVEHVVLTNRATLGRLRRLADGTPMAGVPRFPDEKIVETMFHGIPAPPGLAEPIGRFTTRAEGEAALIAVCDEIAGCAATEGDRLRDVGFAHPVFGMFDGVQWILFLAAHTDNHIPQLRRLRDGAFAI